MLVAESEVYRQLLKLECQTFKVYAVHTKRRMTSFTSYTPWLMAGIPILARLFRRKKAKQSFSLKRFGSLFLLGWKAYQKLAPLLARARVFRSRAESSETAAEEYLSKRL